MVMTSTSRMIKLFTLILMFISMVGCASVKMSPPSASADTLHKLRAANLASSSVGEFGLAPGLKPGLDKSLGGLRGMSLQSANESFSQQLKDTVIVELKAAGLYDEKSELQIEAQLLENQVNAAITTGSAKLAANFTVDKAGKRLFEKSFSVDSQWDSSFIGDIAVPEAINRYSSLYRQLVAKLFDDKDFQITLARE